MDTTWSKRSDWAWWEGGLRSDSRKAIWIENQGNCKTRPWNPKSPEGVSQNDRLSSAKSSPQSPCLYSVSKTNILSSLFLNSLDALANSCVVIISSIDYTIKRIPVFLWDTPKDYLRSKGQQDSFFSITRRTGVISSSVREMRNILKHFWDNKRTIRPYWFILGQHLHEHKQDICENKINICLLTNWLSHKIRHVCSEIILIRQNSYIDL